MSFVSCRDVVLVGMRVDYVHLISYLLTLFCSRLPAWQFMFSTEKKQTLMCKLCCQLIGEVEKSVHE